MQMSLLGLFFFPEGPTCCCEIFSPPQLSALCVAEQRGFSFSLYLGRPWRRAIEEPQRKRWWSADQEERPARSEAGASFSMTNQKEWHQMVTCTRRHSWLCHPPVSEPWWAHPVPQDLSGVPMFYEKRHLFCAVYMSDSLKQHIRVPPFVIEP